MGYMLFKSFAQSLYTLLYHGLTGIETIRWAITIGYHNSERAILRKA